jgi:acyl-CoA synthetase (AMP-forming)/AMP-acid ligase II
MTSSGQSVAMTCCPLMHATGLGVCAIPTLLRGGTLVLLEQRSFDPHEAWTLVERERVAVIVIVGDAFARPMLRALEEREVDGHPYDTSSVRDIVSAGTIWSAEVKDALATRVTARLTDMLGSTEGGIYAVSSADRGAHVATARFSLSAGTRVITEDGRDVVPGSGEQGLLASESNAFGYFKDPEKTQRTFRELDGRSYVLTGDWATVEDDGTITLLGRGSNCINSGGEKVFPEEVEEAVKRHPDVDDCLVVGLPDERFGQRVVAIVGSSVATRPTGEELREWLRSSLAHFKIPKSFVVLDAVRRAPNGKADYGWAREEASAHRV